MTPRPASSAGQTRRRRRWVLALPYGWLVLFFLAPLAIVLKISLAEPLLAQPPYTPLIAMVEGAGLAVQAGFDNFLYLLEEDLYWRAYLSSLRIAATATAIALPIGYPLALAIARARAPWQQILLLAVVLPFATSFLIRVYAWKVLLQGGGLINATLLALGLIEQPLALLYNTGAVYLGIVYTYLPFMVLPLYVSLARLDRDLEAAAADLGAPPWRVFVSITLPLSLPGIVAGALLVFIPAVGEFVIPELLGGPDSLMIGRVLWTEFFGNRDWPLASAVAIVILALLVLPIMAFQISQARAAGARR